MAEPCLFGYNGVGTDSGEDFGYLYFSCASYAVFFHCLFHVISTTYIVTVTVTFFPAKMNPLETAQKKTIWYFMPTSHACSNTLDFPQGNAVLPLPSDIQLFKLYDLAFKNSYFGVLLIKDLTLSFHF